MSLVGHREAAVENRRKGKDVQNIELRKLRSRTDFFLGGGGRGRKTIAITTVSGTHML